MKTNVENNYQTKIKKFSKLELAENRSIKAVVSFAGLFFLSVAGGIISYPVAINTIDEFKESDHNYNAIIENGLSDINERYENGILSQEEYNNEIDQLYSNSNAIEILKNSSSPLKYRYETSITLGSVLFVVSIANVLGALASVEIFANIEEARKRLGREMEISRLQNNIKDADLNPRIIYNYESEENGINYP